MLIWIDFCLFIGSRSNAASESYIHRTRKDYNGRDVLWEGLVRQVKHAGADPSRDPSDADSGLGPDRGILAKAREADDRAAQGLREGATSSSRVRVHGPMVTVVQQRKKVQQH